MTNIHKDATVGQIPAKYHPYIAECVDSGEMNYGYRRTWQEWSTRTNGLTIEFLWHEHDGQSGDTGTVLIVDYKRNGKYIK